MSTAPELDVNKYMVMIRRWLWLLVVATLAAGTLSFVASLALPKTYQASATLVIGDDTANLHPSIDDVTVSQRLAGVYAGMVTREPILTATIAALKLPMNWWDLQRHLLVIRGDGSQLIEIRVTDTDPQRTKATVDELTHQLILQSPTAENEQELEQRRQFVSVQLQRLQSNINTAEANLADNQTKLKTETSARGVLDLQDQIKATELNLTNWRAAYASMLSTSVAKSPNTLTVIQPAYVPLAPVGPNIPINVLTGTLLGLLVATGAALLIEYLKGDRLREVDDVSRALDLPVLGSVGRMPSAKAATDRVVAANAPDSVFAEDYRRLRTNLQFTWASGSPDEPVTLLVTSAGPHEGKSVTSANLAVTFARTGKRTILIDADLLHPSLHSLLGMPNQTGLFDLFWGEADGPSGISQIGRDGEQFVSALRSRAESLLMPTAVPGLRFMSAGTGAEHETGELLPIDEIRNLLDTLRDMADVIIIDGPPVLAVAETTALANMGLGVVLVVAAGETRSDAARLARRELARASSRVLGVVLNKSSTQMPYYNYYYQRSGELHGVPGGRSGLKRPNASKRRAKA
jgi:Mrp family chromosome partitioning ATPase/capsular polysaccharide biosynthesis protein